LPAPTTNNPASRRPGVLAVHSLDHIAFAVPSLTEAKKFYGAFGLDVRTVAGGIELHASGNPDHCWAKISEGPAKRLGYMSFGIFADDLPRFRDKLSSAGLLAAPPSGVQSSESIWMRDL